MTPPLLTLLDELAALEKRATPGEWTRLLGSALIKGATGYNTGRIAGFEDNEGLPLVEWSNPDMMRWAKANANYVTAFRNAHARLDAEVRRLVLSSEGAEAKLQVVLCGNMDSITRDMIEEVCSALRAGRGAK